MMTTVEIDGTNGSGLSDHTFITGWCEEMGCPKHANGVKKTYTFGKYGDAEVVTFKGCGCAVCINVASLLLGVPLGTEYTYHTSYGNASGRATLIKMKESVDNAPFNGPG